MRFFAIICWAIAAGAVADQEAGGDRSAIAQLLDIFGVSTDVSMLRDARELSGDVYVLGLDPAGKPARSLPTPLTMDGGWRWPVFHGHGNSVLALRDNRIVELDLFNGQRVRTWSAPAGQRFVKLLGASRSEPSIVGVLLRDEANANALNGEYPARFSLDTGTATPVRFASAKAGADWLALLQNPVRRYGDYQVETRGVPQRVRISAGPLVVTLPGCAGAHCAQAALAPGFREVVYIIGTP